jgi:hypothetical protein
LINIIYIFVDTIDKDYMPKDKIIINFRSSLAKPTNEELQKAINQHFSLNEPFEGGGVNPFPKPKDFLAFPFRQLSAEQVGSGTWKSTDFSNEAVLREALPLFDGKPAYFNHDQDAKKAIGTLGAAKWTPTYVNEKGLPVPAGIDAPFIIDSVLFGHLCRILNSPTSPIQCCSVAIEFEYEPSHIFENPNDFLWHVGETIDGREVTRIVTKIISIGESSLVHEGAAPHSRKTDENGRLVTLPYSAATDDEKESYQANHCYTVDCEFKGKLQFEKPTAKTMKVVVLDNGKATEATFEKWDNNLIAVDKTLLAQLQERASELETVKGEKVALSAEKNALLLEKENLLREQTELQKQLAPLNELLATKKEKAKALYSAFTNNNPQELLLKEIETADNAKLDVLITTFGGKLAEDFSGVCGDCGSKKVEFRSANPTQKEDKTVVEDYDLTKYNK